MRTAGLVFLTQIGGAHDRDGLLPTEDRLPLTIFRDNAIIYAPIDI